ncbi:hypothetical protein [Sphingobacterium gobiense]|uniref:DUF4827 domain-containing protein n=1 Tax=Sphingobacterium gobiense TaxID=1382456 RepID=A0A2S9JR97_9SPHI|nr:hypothetical protein [Sphingobacterium gobiense]PRD55809.1 hypothetical protein C5749_00485 [Sphingobacterium gobiense]
MNKLFKIATLAFTLVGFAACNNDDEVSLEQEYQASVMIKDGETKDLANVSATINTQGTISRSGSVYSLRNFRQFTINEDGAVTEAVAPLFYFDFKENDGVDAGDAVLTLNATQRDMDIISNTTKGYTLSYIDKAFESVVVTDNFTSAPDEKVGIVTPFSPEGAIGWSNYDMSVHHIVAIANRTLILSKGNTALFKFRVNSIYSNETPNKESASDNYVYYAVDYEEFK